LHSAFDPRLIASLSAQFGDALKLIQTVPYEVDAPHRAAADQRFETALTQAFGEPALRAILIDAAQAGASGGLGVPFDWARAAQILARVRGAHLSSNSRLKVILAGGLRVRNVATAIAALHPWGVDVASGVESAPGRKDPERLRQFLAAARQ
jgi:phosphoribosylanthranilate isomerase